jgi:phage-related protein
MLFLFSFTELWGTVRTTLNQWGTQLMNLIMPFFNALSPYVQAAIVIVAALLSILGVVVIIKKYIKFFVTLAIIGGIGAAVYFFVIRPQ